MPCEATGLPIESEDVPCEPILVADIGGTNARFGLASPDRKGGFRIEHRQSLQSAQFSNFSDLVQSYRDSIQQKVERACLAVAGPVTDDSAQITNLGWLIKRGQIQAALDLKQLVLINDFVAYAHGLRFVDSQDLTIIKAGGSQHNLPAALIGPGTGFGSALLHFSEGKPSVHPLEGGHIALAANNELQANVLSFLRRRFDRVSLEEVFSGRGLVNLYGAIAALEGGYEGGNQGVKEGYKEETNPTHLSARDITQMAQLNANSLAGRTLKLYCEWLGAVSGDFALALGAKGGIFLGGGILPKIQQSLTASEFTEAFQAKGAMSHYVADVPVTLVMADDSGLNGCAAWFYDNSPV